MFQKKEAVWNQGRELVLLPVYLFPFVLRTVSWTDLYLLGSGSRTGFVGLSEYFPGGWCLRASWSFLLSCFLDFFLSFKIFCYFGYAIIESCIFVTVSGLCWEAVISIAEEGAPSFGAVPARADDGARAQRPRAISTSPPRQPAQPALDQPSSTFLPHATSKLKTQQNLLSLLD